MGFKSLKLCRKVDFVWIFQCGVFVKSFLFKLIGFWAFVINEEWKFFTILLNLKLQPLGVIQNCRNAWRVAKIWWRFTVLLVKIRTNSLSRKGGGFDCLKKENFKFHNFGIGSLSINFQYSFNDFLAILQSS